MGRGVRTDWMPGGFGRLRSTGRPVWPEACPVWLRCLFCPLVIWCMDLRQLHAICDLAHRRRCRDWRGFDCSSHVYCRDRTAGRARPAGGFYQFGIVAGILCAVYINLLIERSGTEVWQVAHGWRWMFAAAAAPAILFAIAIVFSKESPRWLMKVGREREAEQVLALV